jgi:uridine kinase
MLEMQNTISIGQEATLERIDETVEHVDGRFDIVDGRFDYVDGRIDDLMKLNTVIATSVNANETRKLKQDLKKCQETIGDLLRKNSSLKLQKSELLREIRRLEKLNEKNLSKLSMKH